MGISCSKLTKEDEDIQDLIPLNNGLGAIWGGGPPPLQQQPLGGKSLSQQQTQIEDLQAQLEAALNASQNQGSIAQELQAQVEQLKQEVKETETNYKNALEKQVKQINSEWKKKMLIATADSASGKKALQLEWEQRLRTELEELHSKLTEDHGKEAEKLNGEINQLRKSLDDAMQTALSVKDGFLEDLEKIKESHQKQLNDLENQHKTELADAFKEKKKGLETMKKELRESHQQQLNDLENQHKTALADAFEKKEKGLETLKKELQESHQQELEKAKNAFDKMTESAKSGHASDLEALKKKHALELEQARNRWEKEQCKALEVANGIMQRSLEELEDGLRDECSAKYENRDSRQEDIDRIAELEKTLLEMTAGPKKFHSSYSGLLDRKENSALRLEKRLREKEEHRQKEEQKTLHKRENLALRLEKRLREKEEQRQKEEQEALLVQKSKSNQQMPKEVLVEELKLEHQAQKAALQQRIKERRWLKLRELAKQSIGDQAKQRELEELQRSAEKESETLEKHQASEVKKIVGLSMWLEDKVRRWKQKSKSAKDAGETQQSTSGILQMPTDTPQQCMQPVQNNLEF